MMCCVASAGENRMPGFTVEQSFAKQEIAITEAEWTKVFKLSDCILA